MGRTSKYEPVWRGYFPEDRIVDLLESLRANNTIHDFDVTKLKRVGDRSLPAWGGKTHVTREGQLQRGGAHLNNLAKIMQAHLKAGEVLGLRTSVDGDRLILSVWFERGRGAASVQAVRRVAEPRPVYPLAQGFEMALQSLHPKVVQRCRIPFQTGQYDDAIFNAMKVVELEVRDRISEDEMDYGLKLIGKAMGGDSPALVFSQTRGEQEAVYHLFRGAIGWFRNPLAHSFRDVSDPIETFECLALASLLMRMLDQSQQ